MAIAAPEVEHVAVTDEGRAVAAALDRPGLWIRSGIDGILTGLDMAQALASVPSNLDVEFMRRLFAVAELGFVSAHLARLKE